MSSRKLSVLNYKKQFIDLEDDKEFITFLCDMDELYLKLKSEDWLATILDEKNSEKQDELVKEYITSLNLDKSAPRKVIANHILDLAIEKLYNNDLEAQQMTAEVYNQATEKKMKAISEDNPFTGIDYKSSEFASLIDELCRTCGIAPYPDPAIRLQAACLFIKQNLSVETIKERNNDNPTSKSFDLESIPLGFPEEKDKFLNTAARILRVLNVSSLRNTQTLINETLVSIQNITIDQTKKPNMSQVQYGKS